MERKSHWPWKRKSSKNSGAIVAVSATASPANHSSRQHEDHVTGLAKLLADQVQEANQRWQEAEEKARSLATKLEAAQSELIEKENHVKQHAKVAEEAVTGWERAESETASIKLQLDSTSRKNTDLESKISQLEASLKESARNSQKAKEEHERRMQDLTARKNKECDRIRQELESRLAEVGHRLLESSAESKVLAATLSDRMRTIAELSEARSSAEAEIAVLNVRLEESGKNNLSLQYEIQVLNKQLQIRDEEKDFCKREAEASQRILQDSAKKIQMLEGEIHRLRALVRRKLPGPAAMAQMKQEVDLWGRDERRRSFGSGKNVGVDRLSKDFQIQLLTERVLSMEEETKLLREVLAQKNNELHAARIDIAAQSECASSVVRGGLKPRAILGAGSASECSVNDEAGSCADAWSSAMISEPDDHRPISQEQKQMNHQEQQEHQEHQEQKRGGILVGDSKFQMMDDFAEMEQLTSSIEAKPDCDREEREAEKVDLGEIVARKEEQLSAANRLCMEISSKLVATEKEFTALQAKNAANEMSLIKLQEKLDLLLEAQGGEKTDEDLEKMIEQRKSEEQEIQIKNSIKNSKELQSALSANVQKVICLVESLAHAIGVEQQDQDGQSLPSPSCSSSSISGSDDQHSTRFEKLTLTSNKLVQGKADFTDFMGELSAALNVVMAASVSSSDNGSEQRPSRIEQADVDSNKVADLQTELKNLSEELGRVRVEKELLHERLRDAKNEISAAERLVDDLKRQVSDLSESRAGLEERIRDAESTVADLREKLDSAEGKYQAEREQHEEISARYRELEKQIDLNRQENAAGGIDHSGENGSHNGDEIAAKLAECQRTILALGKQLKVLSASDKPPPPDLMNCRYYDQERISDAEEMRNLESMQQPQQRDSSSGEFAWSKIKLQQDLEAETIPWSPPRSLESSAEENSRPMNRYGRSGATAVEDSDTNWLYSPDHSAAGFRRSPMRSPGRYLSSKKPGRDATNELYKSVNLPLATSAASKNHSSFTRFFSRNR